eukprot:TRINITY_DN2379_c0_g1_i1.p1 TRINITY_DN2379_c0_g1~~TRINITY_DN2379_c0_g1_i1.p1  ORF type:complete len:937 (-),score=279.16 TRINITY_DN2379_c0_g1_i1:69-2879(-)
MEHSDGKQVPETQDSGINNEEDVPLSPVSQATDEVEAAEEEQARSAQRVRIANILRNSLDVMTDAERAKREEEMWKEYEEENTRRKQSQAAAKKAEKPPAEDTPTKHRRQLSLGPLKLNALTIDEIQQRLGFDRAEKKIEQGIQNVSREVKLVLSPGRSTEDYVSFEGIERVKVNSKAAKALRKSTNKWQLKKRKIHYWLMCFEIGFLVGLTEFLNHEGLAQIQNGRIKAASALIQLGTAGGFFAAWAAYTGLALIATMFGCFLCVYIAPIAKGGGISEVKAYLNGVKIPGLLSLKTGIVKLISTMCSVGAGLAVGQEGPMIHMGSVMGYTCSQMKFKALPGVRNTFAKFQNDRDARDFVASGAAAGVSAAFRSPIGATLFALEEAASFWSHELIWRTFFCCMIAAWSTNFFISGRDEGIEKLIDNPSHVVYRVALGRGFRLPELFAFMGMGIIGGLLGALFIAVNAKINAFRKRTYYKENKWKFLELAIITVVTATLSIVGPLAFGCREVSVDLKDLGDDMEDQDDGLEKQVFEQFTCSNSSYYNPMASLSFANAEVVLKHLYIRSNPLAFGAPTLIFYSGVYYILMAVTAGTWIAAGLLVPQLIAGAAWGRLYGYLLHQVFETVDPGVYALLGSSAFMSGVSRLTIALVVIMIEITGDLEALLPIMTVCMIAKWVGDMFNHSIYEVALHAGGVPFLEPDPPKMSAIMTCKDVMVADRKCVPTKATVQQIYNAMKDLESTRKNIPVVDAGPDGTGLYLVGSIPRNHLAILLQEKAYERRGYIDVAGTRLKQEAISLTPEELQMTIDIEPYSNMATFSVKEEFPLYLAYRIYRTQGLREVFVVSDRNELRGRIAREQLMLDQHGPDHGAAHGAAHVAPHGAGHSAAHSPVAKSASASGKRQGAPKSVHINIDEKDDHDEHGKNVVELEEVHKAEQP